MKHSFSVLIIGGDDRYLEVIHQLIKQNGTIYLAGFENVQVQLQHNRIHHVKLDKMDVSQLDGLLLPVSGTSAQGRVEHARFTNEPLIVTEELIKNTPSHCKIFTGISNGYLNEVIQRTDRTLVEIFKRDDVAILNAIPTAEGILALAIKHTNYTIHGARVMILGFGRVGMTVARLFAAIGASVYVGARNPTAFARAKEMGLIPFSILNEMDKAKEMDIIINTIPTEILNTTVLSTLSDSTLIIDIASNPGGTNFQFAKEKGITAIHALGLPGKVAPKTAGTIIADVIIKNLIEQ
ncbi:dipicolinate synthase subunit DpsA [Virgibacillus sp. LDC-1]|uniref:dipicolinate synthase subunit DpsA n=1 Tax=Virgibacillus sp. LDC-1 TaxID=3039856 RepID=UPI0024DECEDF|nr:dipicolinate synthase subunit DpsA [Virgibacillus sp. LDC-1]